MRSPQIFCKNWNLADGLYIDAMLKMLFLEQLPDNVRSILAISDRSVQIALQADKVMDMSKTNVAQVYAVSRASSTENAAALCECKNTMDKISK